MEFEKVLNGVVRYIDRNLYKNMNSWQTFLARVSVSRMIRNTESLKSSIVNNPFIRTFDVFNPDGTIKLDDLMTDIKQQIRQQGKLEIDIPMFGKFTFTPEDVDELHRVILEG